MDKITLDRDTFKALASDTRLDILKALDVRQKTVTELAKELDLNKATVFEHLEKLEAVALIQRIEEDVERKWVYWQLSWKGRRLLHPEAITLALLLSSALGTLLTAAAAAWLWWRSNVASLAQPTSDASPGGKAAAPSIAAQAPVAPSPEAAASVAHDPALMAWAIGLALLTLLLIGGAWWVRTRARRTAKAA